MPPSTPLTRILRVLHLGNHDHSSEIDSVGTTLASDGQSGQTMVELQIMPYPSACLPGPPSRTWLPTRIPDDYDYKHKRICTMYAPHDASAPIRGVPSAVLTRIFTVHGVFHEWREILKLTHVCRAWRRVALTTPRLWANAVWSLSRTWSTSGHRERFMHKLLVFLERTLATHPVRVEMVHMAHQRHIWKTIVPHLSKLSSLSVLVRGAEEIVDVLETLRLAGMASLAVFELVSDRIPYSSLARLIPWRDSDFPCLRELKILCAAFSRIAPLRSIKAIHLVGASGYVGGLWGCAETLESLTLEPWHTRIRSDHNAIQRSDNLRIHLPKVRRVSITGHERHVMDVFASLTFPKDVHIDLTFWDRTPAPLDICDVLPAYITGFHAAPLVDSLQFRLGSTLQVVARCLVGEVERLCIKRSVRSSPMLQATISTFCIPSVTEIAVNLTSLDVFSARYTISNPIVKLIRHLKALRRLELLGATRRNVKFRILEGFLRRHGRPAASNADCLTVAWAIQFEHGVGAAVDELEQLIEVLTAHHVTSGARLARLELCVTTDMDLDKYKCFYRVRDLSPSWIWSARVAKRFLGRLDPLADEVVILGDWEKYADDIEEEDEWCGGGGSIWKEAVTSGSYWDWGPGGDVVVTRCRIEGHICRSCQEADIYHNSSDEEEDTAEDTAEEA